MVFDILCDNKSVTWKTWNGLSYPLTNYTAFLFRHHQNYTKNVAIIDAISKKEYTYGYLIEEMHKVSSLFNKMGISNCEMIFMLLPICVEYVICYLGLMSNGYTVSSYNNGATKRELLNLLEFSLPKYFIIEKKNASLIVNVVRLLKIENARIFLIDEESQCEDDIEIFSLPNEISKETGDASILFNDNNTDFKNDIAAIPYSSGTTGLPKGVMLSHENICANLQQMMHSDFFKSSEIGLKFLSTQPFYHISNLVIFGLTFYNGNTLIFLPNADEEPFFRTIEEYKITTLALTPPRVHMIVNSTINTKYDLSSVNLAFCGAAMLTQDMNDKFYDFFQQEFKKSVPLVQAYGASEMSPITHFAPINSKKGDKVTIGKALPGIEWKVVDTITAVNVPPNVPGSLVLKGPNVMKGYLKNEGATKKAFDSDGWYIMGDLVVYDENENIYVRDRLKDTIKYCGMQVSPTELESVLLSHPKVLDAAVIGIPDDVCGELPFAYVVKQKTANVNSYELIEFVNNQVMDRKRLRGGLKFIDKIIKSDVGKILRREMEKKFVEQS